jgi:ferredoxin-nitrite reductase
MNKIEAIKAERDGLDVIDDLARFAAEGFGSIPEDDFERLKWYGLFRRKPTPGYFMVRLRIPNGILTSAQMRELGNLTVCFGRGTADITTRQNIQLRWVTIEQAPALFERLRMVGLTAQQSGMDNVRNYVGCPIAGLDPDEVLDASPLTYALQEAILNKRAYSNLPRKFNVSISGCRQDCGHAQANDLGFTPATAPDGTAGFNVWVGGALGGKEPHLGEPLDAFVRPAEVVEVTCRVLEVFRDHGPRESRLHARLKVLLCAWGVCRFRAEVERRLGRPLAPAGWDEVRTHGGDHIGVHAQRQPGHCYVGLLVPVGRITGRQMKDLARLAEEYGAGELRLTTDQNVLIPHVREQCLSALLDEPLLAELTPAPHPVMRGLVTCTGNDYCHFSLIDTKGRGLELARLLAARLPDIDPATRLRLHMSGCPHACGQHQIADIGLQAARVRRDGVVLDAADVFRGGSLGPGGRLAAKTDDNVTFHELPDLLEPVIRARVPAPHST